MQATKTKKQSEQGGKPFKQKDGTELPSFAFSALADKKTYTLPPPSAQNQLPTWIAQSTVSGEISSLQLERDARLAAREGATDPVPTPLLPGALPTSPTRPERPAGAAGDAPRENGEAEDTLGDLSSYYANLNSVVAAAPPPPALDEASAFASVVGTTQVAGSDNEEDDDDDDDDDFDNEMEGIAAVTSRSAQQQPSASAADGVVDEAQNRGDKKRIRSPVNGVDEGPAALKKLKVDEVDGPSAGDGENPLVKVGDAMVPFLDVDEDVQNLMVRSFFFAFVNPVFPVGGVSLTCLT